LGWPLESGSLLDSNLKNAQESFYSLLTAVEKETYGKQYSAGLVGLCENAIVKRNSMNIDSSAESSFSWLKDVFYVPENLTFWFDFLDTSGELSKI
jgi:hypothetical protein